MHEALEEYGLKCANFSIEAIDIEDDELRREYDRIGIDVYGTVRRAQAETQGARIKLDGLGPDYLKVQGLEILKTVASNPGAGGIAAAGAGLGMGLGTAGVIGTIAQGVFGGVIPSQNGNILPQSPPTPPQPGGRFTQQTAADREGLPAESSHVKSPAERMKEIKTLLDLGCITQEEYDEKKKKIIDSI